MLQLGGVSVDDMAEKKKQDNIISTPSFRLISSLVFGH